MDAQSAQPRTQASGDRESGANPADNNTAAPAAPQRPKIQQPKPQALPNRSGPSSILVSSRQKGNPILNHIKLLPWEYADIPADYVIGLTTCALFLSLKYHRLHPEYIYSRVRLLAGKYNLRIVLVMVDIPNHEDPLKELSKTSIINNLTLILCWSAPEAAHYLELFKSSENAQPTAIRTQQPQSYKDSLVEFVTTPRSINKSDTASLISTFGSLQNAINAQPEQINSIPGWGERKVQQWCSAVREDFRVESTKKGGSAKPVPQTKPTVSVRRLQRTEEDEDEEIVRAVLAESRVTAEVEAAANEASSGSKQPSEGTEGNEGLSDGIAAALARLRNTGA